MTPTVMTPAQLDQHLASGQPLPDGDLVIGEDYYGGDDTEAVDITETDAISDAVGLPAYVSDHMAHECFQVFEDGSQTEPEIFDRYYFPPQEDGYEGVAPILIDIVDTDVVTERAADEEAKHVAFKRAWCDERGLRYAVLYAEDLGLSVEKLRARLTGDDETATETEATGATETSAPRRRGGVQRPRAQA